MQVHVRTPLLHEVRLAQVPVRVRVLRAPRQPPPGERAEVEPPLLRRRRGLLRLLESVPHLEQVGEVVLARREDRRVGLQQLLVPLGGQAGVGIPPPAALAAPPPLAGRRPAAAAPARLAPERVPRPGPSRGTLAVSRPGRLRGGRRRTDAQHGRPRGERRDVLGVLPPAIIRGGRAQGRHVDVRVRVGGRGGFDPVAAV